MSNEQQPPPFIDSKTVEALEKASDNPPVKLIEHCKALNDAHTAGNYTNVMMLIRAIIDYIPTVFGFTTAADVASQFAGRQSMKAALKQVDNASRNLADHALHIPARKNETLVVSKPTVDNLQGQLGLILSETADQLRNNDQRDEGNLKLAEKQTPRVKPQRSQIETFEDYLENETWTKEYIDDRLVWVCDKDNLYQIVERDDYENFTEPWTQVYADKNGSGKHSADLVYNGSVIKQVPVVYADGGRIVVTIPKIDGAGPKVQMPDGSEAPRYYWEKESLEFKLMKVIGSFYMYKDPAGVAKMSRIEIR